MIYFPLVEHTHNCALNSIYRYSDIHGEPQYILYLLCCVHERTETVDGLKYTNSERTQMDGRENKKKQLEYAQTKQPSGMFQRFVSEQSLFQMCCISIFLKLTLLQLLTTNETGFTNV